MRFDQINANKLLQLSEDTKDFSQSYILLDESLTKFFLICCVCKPGILKQDPELPPDQLLNLPPPRPKNAIFEDEEKSKVRKLFGNMPLGHFLPGRMLSRLCSPPPKGIFLKPHLSPLCLLCQTLSRLLNSSHPEDLKAANKLIKEMVQEVNLSATAFVRYTLTALLQITPCVFKKVRYQSAAFWAGTVME